MAMAKAQCERRGETTALMAQSELSSPMRVAPPSVLALAVLPLLLLIGDAVLLSPTAEAPAAEAVLLNVDAVLPLMVAAGADGGWGWAGAVDKVYDYALSCECLCLCQCRHWRRGPNAFSSHRAPSAVRLAHERDGEIPLPLSEGVALKHGCLCPTDV